MPVPVGDSVCRFIRKTDWSTALNKPKAKSFKQRDMSVWHEGRLTAQGATLDDLQIGDFTGSGRLNLTVADYLDIASQVSSRTGRTFQVQVEWRPEDQYVKEPWRQWRDAHAQLEMLGTSLAHFPPEFRNLLII